MAVGQGPALVAGSVVADGVRAISTSGNGLTVSSTTGAGVEASSLQGIGVWARSAGSGPSGVGLRVDGCLQLAPNSSGTSAVGQVTIPAGALTLSVVCPAATAGSTILLTPLGDPGVRLWIHARGPEYFIISASGPVSAQTDIQYLVIN
jgi:hypothetical protein